MNEFESFVFQKNIKTVPKLTAYSTFYNFEVAI